MFRYNHKLFITSPVIVMVKYFLAQSQIKWFPKKGVKIYSDISQLNIVKLLTVMYSVKKDIFSFPYQNRLKDGEQLACSKNGRLMCHWSCDLNHYVLNIKQYSTQL